MCCTARAFVFHSAQQHVATFSLPDIKIKTEFLAIFSATIERRN
jgi:hypothetical protein